MTRPEPTTTGSGSGPLKRPTPSPSVPAKIVGAPEAPAFVFVIPVERPAMIVLNGWGGLFEQRVTVVGETRTRYRIRARERVRLAGRHRYLEAGTTGLVPKHAVTFLG